MKKGLLGVVACFWVVLAIFVTPRLFSNNLSSNPDLLIKEGGKRLPPFSFAMSGGHKFTNHDLLNNWTLFFIGYTFCPDICPTTLADLDRVYPELSKAPYNNIQIVFVSVDPNRDKAAHLAEYVHYFNPHFTAVTGTHKQLFPFVQNLGLVYSIVEQGEAEQYYLVDHSASLVLVNPNGEHHATFQARVNENGIAQVNMDLMVEDIHQIQQKWHK
jgi:protein SCO1/2